MGWIYGHLQLGTGVTDFQQLGRGNVDSIYQPVRMKLGIQSQELGRLVLFGNLNYSEALKGRIRSALLDNNFIARDALVELVMDHEVASEVLDPVILAMDDLSADSDLDSLGSTLRNDERLSETSFPSDRHLTGSKQRNLMEINEGYEARDVLVGSVWGGMS